MVSNKPGFLAKPVYSYYMQVSDISTQQLELLFGSFPECLCVFNPKGQLSKVNPAFCKLSGYSETDLITQPFINFIHPDDYYNTLKALEKMQKGELPPVFECRFLFKDSEYKWISWNCFMSNANGWLYCSVRNISVPKELEARLLKTIQQNKSLVNTLQLSYKKLAENEKLRSNERIDYIIENCTDGFFTLSKDWKVLALNQKARHLLTLSHESTRQSYFWSLFPVEKDHQLFKQAEKAFDSNQTVHFEEFYPHLDKWMEVTVYPHSETVTLVFKNIDLSKKQELENLRLARDYKVLFSNNPQPMWAYDIDRLKILMVNDSALSLYGYTREEFLNLNLYDLRPETEHARLRRELNGGDIYKDLKLTAEWQHQKKDGTIIYVDIASHRMKLNDHDARLIVANNITARRKAQIKLVNQNSRLREIAQLSSHDLRGPVASILGLVSLFDEENIDFSLNNQIIENLKISAKDLDKVIHAIVKKTYYDDK